MTTATDSRLADSPADGTTGPARVARFATGVLAYTLFVILFGAVVRITGSGAGCGQHWPTCQGELVHLPKTVETLIELSHRLTSGLSAVLVGVLVFLSFRTFRAGHPVRVAATASGALMVTESAVGAALVLLRLVGHNTSVARAVVMAVHLVNTSFLMGAILLTAVLARGERAPTFDVRRPSVGRVVLALAGTLVVSITGAITALGDTLYPVETTRSLALRLAADQSATATFLERGRAVHPLVAFTVAVLVFSSVHRIRTDVRVASVTRATGRVLVVLGVQLAAGVLNVLLSAPGYVQVLHLGIATALWLSLVLLAAEVARVRNAEPVASK
ncbi:MAG TPA: COX15/CtaA family protein [Polyangiaceae bacterium]|nr:COX15/CtaA family protein [Polyangiaceae bacterium]